MLNNRAGPAHPDQSAHQQQNINHLWHETAQRLPLLIPCSSQQHSAYATREPSGAWDAAGAARNNSGMIVTMHRCGTVVQFLVNIKC